MSVKSYVGVLDTGVDGLSDGSSLGVVVGFSVGNSDEAITSSFGESIGSSVIIVGVTSAPAGVELEGLSLLVYIVGKPGKLTTGLAAVGMAVVESGTSKTGRLTF